MQIKLPKWLEEVPEERQLIETTRFYLRIAALYVDPEGRLSALSLACGLAESTLATVSKRVEKLSPETAILIERTVGRDLMPRELFRPDLFTISE